MRELWKHLLDHDEWLKYDQNGWPLRNSNGELQLIDDAPDEAKVAYEDYLKREKFQREHQLDF